jgi:hypothetical protein
VTETTAPETAPAESLSIADAVASVRGHEPPAREVGVDGPVYDHGDAGLHQAAEELGRKRRQREEQHAISPEFAAEIERALPAAQAKFQAQAAEISFADDFEKGQKLGTPQRAGPSMRPPRFTPPRKSSRANSQNKI